MLEEKARRKEGRGREERGGGGRVNLTFFIQYFSRGGEFLIDSLKTAFFCAGGKGEEEGGEGEGGARRRGPGQPDILHLVFLRWW